jgi:hypothetical protein
VKKISVFGFKTPAIKKNHVKNVFIKKSSIGELDVRNIDFQKQNSLDAISQGRNI